MADKQPLDLGVGRAIQSKYEGSQKKLVIISFCALIGAFNFGLSIGYSSPSIPSMIKRGVLTKEEGDWFASLLTIGALVGGPFGGWLLEKLGRKGSLIILSVPFTVGFFFIGTASDSIHCYFGRFLTGIASGMVTVCVPMYIAEISTTSMRGILGSCVQLLITIGIAAAYTLGFFYEWRMLANIFIVPSVIGGLLALLIPETPRYLLARNRKPDAIQSLKALRDTHTDVNEECRELEEGSDPEESISFSAILKKRELSYPLMLIICILVFQQLSGINAVMFYTVSIFETAVKDFAYIATVIVGIVQIFATMLAVYLMDKAGRRKLLHIGGLVTSVSLFAFGLYYRMADSGIFNQFMLTWFPVVCLTSYIIGFSLGWGPIPMLLMSELIPTRCKGSAGSLAICASWGSAFIVTSQFTLLQATFGNSGVFYAFSACCAVSVWFVARYIPETKGKSLEDIEMLFAGKSTLVV